MAFDEFLNIEPYSLDRKSKQELLTKRLKELTDLHGEKCSEYGNILKATGYNKENVMTAADIPFLPVRLFKELNLKSIQDGDVVKTMTSSGTTGQMVSKIYLDKTTSSNQQKTMVKIVSDYTGSTRMPMIIIDCPSVIKNRNMFSARGAGILGFSIFGSKKIYALNDDMKLDIDGIKAFLNEHNGEKILLFGFTFMVWQYFYKELIRLKKEGITFDLSKGILIHGGGWKKLSSEAVSSEEFKNSLEEVCGIKSVHDYYGMVEQTGCIYMECECGRLHASNFSDVFIRNPHDFSVCDAGEKGIIQVVSSIPESYPGHSLLTEDEGMILGEDDCPCGRKGKYFKILGRIKNAEIRGCSDTFAANLSRMTDAGKNDNASKESSNDIDNIPGGIKYEVGNEQIIKNIQDVNVKGLFDEEIIEFLNDISGILMKNKNARLYPDVITLAFWLRKASVLKLKDRFLNEDGNLHVGKGVIFHIAPSNVPVNYAYSLFSGLMCGNANIVRIPSKDFPQISIINAAINEGLEKYPETKKYVCLVRYDRDNSINDYLSQICDVRVIWGGDDTINEIRKSSVNPRTTEVTFADRYSIAVIDVDSYMNIDNKDKVAQDFYNDTFLTDQNACTSPRVVIWLGKDNESAKKEFWDILQKNVDERYDLPPVRAVDKLSMLCLVAAEFGENLLLEKTSNNLITRVCVSSDAKDNNNMLNPKLMNYRGNSGFFYEYSTEDIMDIKDICNDNRCQTIGYIGDTESFKPLLKSGIKGVDRIVPIGKTMDFDLLWDGYDLTERFTRTIVL